MVKPFGVALPHQRCGQSIASADQRPEPFMAKTTKTQRKIAWIRKTQFAKYLQYFSSILSLFWMMLYLKGDFTFFFLHLFFLYLRLLVFLSFQLSHSGLGSHQAVDCLEAPKLHKYLDDLTLRCLRGEFLQLCLWMPSLHFHQGFAQFDS